ncbi:hypothetical protein EDEG_03465 [Edhazardia aedis USNM 41457]|uniref:Glutamate--cysteine ligase n=1 Tax=Edhazardia aedis (strain USNM 41457) TaxID=1003232 RepID=J9DHK7_EDHAE|nr:hypothetical protein EDEG_03465 [Edhazardia aedis USNM 41457]|eukprot:EJW02080.1 hypothetical protein EDEG_03465 [Edhazardia aedis USNM 41457]
MGQGMGCCCLQVTLQAKNIDQGRKIYDMLGSICPLFLRLTRATPIAQGKLLQSETRWDMLSFSVDCRTNSERGTEFNISGESLNHVLTPEEAIFASNINLSDDLQAISEKNQNNFSKSNRKKTQTLHSKYIIDENASKIPKSRYGSIDLYISNDDTCLDEYNDINVPMNMKSYKQLIDANIDKKMARHVASLFIRDPILVYDDSSAKEKILMAENSIKKPREIRKFSNVENLDVNITKNMEKIDNTEIENISSKKNTVISDNNNSRINAHKFNTDDFENIQSSNWRSMRFKLPSQEGLNDEKGWKVEFRPMEIQPTAFENAAWSIFIIILSRALIEYKINLYIPISCVDENFRRANICYNSISDYSKQILQVTDQSRTAKKPSKSVNSKLNSTVFENSHNSSFYKNINIMNISDEPNTDSNSSLKTGIVAIIEKESNETTSNLTKIKDLNGNLITDTNVADKIIDAVKDYPLKDKATFFYRSNINENSKAIVKEGSLEEIFLGNNDYEGLLNIVKRYIKEKETDVNILKQLDKYINFIQGRIEGKYMSVSDYIRKFIINHKDFKVNDDSLVDVNIIDDLLTTISNITDQNSPDYLHSLK